MAAERRGLRRVVVLGAASPSCRWANELPLDVELWGMNMCHRFLSRPAQRWFQMHHRMHNAANGEPPGHFGRPLDHERFLATCGIPVYMQDVDAAIPTSVRYPLEAVSERFGAYFTSTIPYMMALAIHEGVDELGLYGIYLDQASEYAGHRPCVEYWLGVAKGLGIEVVLPPGCTLTRAPLYAYDEFLDPMGTLTLQSVEVVNG